MVVGEGGGLLQWIIFSFLVLFVRHKSLAHAPADPSLWSEHFSHSCSFSFGMLLDLESSLANAIDSVCSQAPGQHNRMTNRERLDPGGWKLGEHRVALKVKHMNSCKSVNAPWLSSSGMAWP